MDIYDMDILCAIKPVSDEPPVPDHRAHSNHIAVNSQLQ